MEAGFIASLKVAVTVLFTATPVALLSLWSLGKVPALLNFTTGPATMLACAQLAGLKYVITSRAFVEKARWAGVPVQVELWEGMFHCSQVFAGQLPEGQEAIDHAGDFIRNVQGR